MLLAIVALMPHHGLARIESVLSTEDCPEVPLVISEFYPGGLADDEYIVISNHCDLRQSLGGWSLSDGEGWLLFISDLWLAPRECASVSWNTSSFESAFGSSPTVSMRGGDISGLVRTNGSFRLADSGDSLALFFPDGRLADFVCYGSSDERSSGWAGQPIPNIKRGEVVKRIKDNDALRDTDTALDWLHFREFRYGYTMYGCPSFLAAPGSVTAFVSPDCSLEVVLETLERARSRISLCTYEFSSVHVTTALLGAMDRGASVRILVDGSPAGGMSSGEIACLSVLAREGADVRALRGNVSKDVVQHVAAVHAKYIVVDRQETIAMSENVVEQGVPIDRIFGNRGWGVRIDDADLAAFVEGIFEDDRRASRSDVLPWLEEAKYNSSAVLPDPPSSRHAMHMLDPFEASGAVTVTVLASPDSSETAAYICDIIKGSESIVAEQFQADPLWRTRWSTTDETSPIMTDILSVLKEGGRARLLFDSSWYNLERNGATMSMLFGNSTLAGLEGEFALMDERSPIATLHNKGAVFDDRYALVSSNNWVWASYARNRELGVLLDSHEVSRYFEEAFELDWCSDVSAPIACAGPDREIVRGESVELSSEGSSDDRIVASVRWDMDGDGLSDSYNSTLEFAGLVSGSFRVVLTVEDAWGNMATDEVLVTVLTPDDGGVRRARPSDGDFGWLLPLAVGMAILCIRRRRRPRRSEAPRKLNHGPRS